MTARIECGYGTAPPCQLQIPPERWNSNLTLLSQLMDNYDVFVFINPIISSDTVVARKFHILILQ